MSYLGVLYKHDRDEDFEPFLAAFPIPPEKKEAFRKAKPTTILTKDGDVYTLKVDTPTRHILMHFKDGEEFVEEIPDDAPAKTTFTVKGNVVTQVQKAQDGSVLTFTREYIDNELVLSITYSGYDGVAKRIFVAQEPDSV